MTTYKITFIQRGIEDYDYISGNNILDVIYTFFDKHGLVEIIRIDKGF